MRTAVAQPVKRGLAATGVATCAEGRRSSTALSTVTVGVGATVVVAGRVVVGASVVAGAVVASFISPVICTMAVLPSSNCPHATALPMACA